MSDTVRQLSPTKLWNHFADLNQVPRGSKKEERVIEFMVNYGKSLGLDTHKDETGNVIIRKPATPGMENRQPVILQSHLDMVHQKNNDTVFDFDKDGIKMYIDGDWVKAHGTTLGADNGIGVSTIMTILAADDIPHPDLEALFTIDEETGMTGAFGLKGGVLNGKILLNLDTENDTEIDIGCAGGLDVTATRTYTPEKLDHSDCIGLQIGIKGLQGGHSGVDIHLGRGNANKLLNRILYNATSAGMRLASFDGGSLRNAIPREASAITAVTAENKEKVLTQIHKDMDYIRKEYQSIESQIELYVNETTVPEQVLSVADQQQMLAAIYTAHNGVFRMSPDIEDLVEASNNVARVLIKDGESKVMCLSRSSVESSKLDVAHSLEAAFGLAGFETTFTNGYPGWTPNPNSPILNVLTSLYEKMYGEKADVVACHAGLECGILGINYPELDMISYGPTIIGAHSPDERVSISSVQKFWKFTQEILKNIPEKG